MTARGRRLVADPAVTRSDERSVAGGLVPRRVLLRVKAVVR